jgi:hypothetical protein
MSRRLTLSELLNPKVITTQDANTAEALVDIRPYLSTLMMTSAPIHAPPGVAKWLSDAVDRLNAQLPGSSAMGVAPGHLSQSLSMSTPSDATTRSSSPSCTFSLVSFPTTATPKVQTNIKLNRKTTLSHLYTYEDVHAYVEYPETSVDDPVGHLFRQDPDKWQDPARNFAYALGFPSGRTLKGAEVTCGLLHEMGNKEKLVLCTESHFTCVWICSHSRRIYFNWLVLGQGSKVCPYSDMELMKTAHTSASRNDLRARLLRDRENHIAMASPTRDIFVKTAALISVFRDVGCNAPMQEPTVLPPAEYEYNKVLSEHQAKRRRGYIPGKEICQGRLSLQFNKHSKPFVM